MGPLARAMGRPWRGLLLILIAMIAAAGAVVAAEPAPAAQDAAAALARPVSPGAIALLVAHANSPAAQTRLQEALKDTRPEVRAVAARVAFITKSMGLLPALRAALQQERDDVAAAELVRAVMTLGGTAAHADAMAAATTIRGHAVDAAIETMARLGARELSAQVAPLLAADAAREPFARALVGVTKGDAAARAALLRDGAVASDPVLRVSLIRALRAAGDAPPPDVLVAWLNDDVLRADAIWHVALTLADRGASSVPPEVMAALAPHIEATRSAATLTDATRTAATRAEAPRTVAMVADVTRTAATGPTPTGPTATGPTATGPAATGPAATGAAATGTAAATWDALGLELIARMTGQAASTRSWRGLPDAIPLALRGFPRARDVYKSLSDAERAEIGEAGYKDREALEPPKVLPGLKSFADTKPPADARPLRTVPPFVGGLWQDLSAVTGCKPTKDRVVIATLTYHPEGRARSVGVEHHDLPEPCVTMAATLYALTISPAAEPTSAAYVEHVVVPLTDTTVPCANEPPPPPSRVRQIGGPTSGGNIRAPKKVQDVRPFYPKSALDEGVEGLVILDAAITTSGCVASARVVRAVDVRLDVAALVSVLQWRYTPTLLDNQPVPVTMTVTVSFFLKP